MYIKLKDKKIGLNQRCFIVAELSANHSGKIENIFKLIDIAKKIKVDAVKIQTYKPDTITLDVKKKDFLIEKNSKWHKEKYLWNLYSKAHTPWEWHKEIFKYAKRKKMIVFSSPFDETAVDLLESLNCPAYKIASPEINHIPLLKKVANTGKPIIISTGLANLEDIKLAIKTVRNKGNNKIILLKCTTEYPAPLESINLKTINDINKKFGVIPGFSDHTLGNEAAIASVVMGSKLLEKHIYLKGQKTSVDKFFSIDEKQFSQLVKNIRNTEKSIGVVEYKVNNHAKKNLRGMRSIYFSENLKKGEIITKKNIKIVRPSFGLHPKYYEHILGKKVKKNYKIGDRVNLNWITKK